MTRLRMKTKRRAPFLRQPRTWMTWRCLTKKWHNYTESGVTDAWNTGNSPMSTDLSVPYVRHRSIWVAVIRPYPWSPFSACSKRGNRWCARGVNRAKGVISETSSLDRIHTLPDRRHSPGRTPLARWICVPCARTLTTNNDFVPIARIHGTTSSFKRSGNKWNTSFRPKYGIMAFTILCRILSWVTFPSTAPCRNSQMLLRIGTIRKRQNGALPKSKCWYVTDVKSGSTQDVLVSRKKNTMKPPKESIPFTAKSSSVVFVVDNAAKTLSRVYGSKTPRAPLLCP